MLYSAEIERYLSTLPGKKPGEMAGDSSKKKTRNSLTAFMGILEKNGRSWPDENDYAEYTAGKPDNKATQQNLSRVRKFFLWLEGEKAQHMTNEINNTTQEITQTQPQTQKKRGRKTIDGNGEIRSIKLTVYVTPTLESNIDAWSVGAGVTFSDLVNKLLNSFFRDKEKILNNFKMARNELRLSDI